MSPEPPLDATGIARRQFAITRKGYDQGEVRAYLTEVSDLVGRLHRGEAHEHDRAVRAEERAELAEQLDEHRLVEILGQETARVLDAARAAAGDIRAKAEESAARMVREAQAEARTVAAQAEKAATTRRAEILAEADELRREAEDEVERRRMEGQVVVDDMRRQAEEERERMLEDGERARSEAEAAAEQIRAAAREQGRRLVGEAQLVRERMLGDLSRRRRVAREQLERLNGARERLLAAYQVVKRTVDEATTELTVALPQARLASEVAARRVLDEPEESVEVLEAELSVARMSGRTDATAAEVSDDELDAMLRGLAEEAAAAAAASGAGSETDDEPEAVLGTDAVGPTADPADPATTTEHILGPDSTGALSDGTVSDAAAGAAPEAIDGPPPGLGPSREMSDGEKWGIRLPRAKRTPPSQAAAVPQAAPASPVVEAPPAPTALADEPEHAPAEADEGETGPYVDELFARIRGERVPGAAGEDDPAAAEVTGPAPAAGASPEAADEAVDAEAPDEDDADPATRALRDRDILLAVVERELGRRLKRVLADEQNEVLDTLRRGGTVEFHEVVPAADEHADRFAIAATTQLDGAAQHGAQMAGGEKAGSCDELAGSLGVALVDPLRVRMQRSFDDCDGDLEEVSERLRALYREWKGQHIGAAVRHYTAAAYAAGAFGAVDEGATVRWVVDASCDACPDCDDNALAGDVAKGDPFPTGDTCSPAHPDCRCLVVAAAALDVS
jgi:cell division septum initiation protein DivIVA